MSDRSEGYAVFLRWHERTCAEGEKLIAELGERPTAQPDLNLRDWAVALHRARIGCDHGASADDAASHHRSQARALATTLASPSDRRTSEEVQ